MSVRLFYKFLFILTVLGAFGACEKILPPAPPENELLDGPVSGLNGEEKLQFLSGDMAFNDEVFTPDRGLGPLFVATSCGSCHAGDGKGTPFTTLTRFGQSDTTGNPYLHLGAPQLQHRAIAGFAPEELPSGVVFSRFTPPAVTGSGFLDFVSDADILAMSDEADADGDGISGVPNWITLPGYVQPKADAISVAGRYIGRFGKKASTYDLLQQTATAYNQDIGIASTFEPFDTYSGQMIDPEVSNRTIHEVVFYLRTLKAPLPRKEGDPVVLEGKQIFGQIKCASCHKPELKTGYSPIAALSNQIFYPYTDLLLHDMGGALDDGYTEGSANTAEWRTPPLWGLGLSPDSQGGQYFLIHDGRAGSIEQAILLHGGEAESSRSQYQSLDAGDKQKLLIFLESL